jgi:hypothetical protein
MSLLRFKVGSFCVGGHDIKSEQLIGCLVHISSTKADFPNWRNWTLDTSSVGLQELEGIGNILSELSIVTSAS